MGQQTQKVSDFYCTQCGSLGLPIIRTANHTREPGHLKRFFCLHCQKECNMVEVRMTGKYTLNDFWIEYNYHNFDENGVRKEPWKRFVAEIKKQGVI